MAKYKTDGGLKFIEEDDYNDGCLPNTAREWDCDAAFEADSVDELISDMCEHLCCDYDALLLNSCDENGRIDIQTLENDDSCEPSAVELAAWKKGRLKLYSCTYSYRVFTDDQDDIDLHTLMRWEGVDK
jgi:hypothetical protein